MERDRQDDDDIFNRLNNDLTEESEGVPPEVHTALIALLSEPFPERPFALIPQGEEGGRGRDYQEYVIHKDIASEHQCVFLFDSIVDAFQVAEEYKKATGKEAEPIPCDIYSLEEDRFWVKFYRSNGAVAIMSLPDYKSNIGAIPEE